MSVLFLFLVTAKNSLDDFLVALTSDSEGRCAQRGDYSVYRSKSLQHISEESEDVIFALTKSIPKEESSESIQHIPSTSNV